MITKSIALEDGIEMSGQTVKEFTIRKPTLGDQVLAFENPKCIKNAAYAQAFILASTFVPPITVEQVVTLTIDDMDVVSKAFVKAANAPDQFPIDKEPAPSDSSTS